uniref:Uncharacterized protein n=1 Tax=Acrobeloides nanus TaxID=290746 RepID=A0A914C3W2_9BILA
MFMVGVFDMIAIPVDAIIPGAYLAVCISCCILAIDRFFVMLFPEVARKLFDGKVIYLWMSIPLLYVLLYATINTSCFFSIQYLNYHFDPFIGTKGLEGNPVFYSHPTMILASILEIIIMGPAYTIICIVLFMKPKNLQTISKLQKVILMQSLAICFEMFFVATVYVGNQWVPLPEFMTKIEHLFLIFVHGDTPIVYLCLNATLRRQFFEIVKAYMIQGRKNCRAVIEFATSIYPNTHRVHAEQHLRATDSPNGVHIDIK